MLREVVSRIRKEARVSQRELSARLRMPHTHITRVEAGQRTLDLIEFVDIVEKLGRDPQEVFAIYISLTKES